MAEIFVSYSNEDRDRVTPLVGKLEAAGYSVWWDRQLQGGALFSETIEEEIEKSNLVIVVWSKASIRSQWVADEAGLGQRDAKLLPVTLDDIEPPIGFRQIQSIPLSGENAQSHDAAVQTLIRAIEHHLVPKKDLKSKDASTKEPPDASIGVLPFVNMSSDPEQEYFSDGISEELLNLLAKIPQMHVTARTSCFQFKGKNQDITKIGEILGVVHILEGSIRKSGNRVRITAQLIEVATGFHKWSETYDRTLDDIFAIQDEISAAIVEALKEHILVAVKAPIAERSTSTKAYEDYLRGQQLINRRTLVDIDAARGCFQDALAIDPDFLPAMIGLVDAHLLSSDDKICYGSVPLHDALAMAEPVLERAVGHSPASEDVHAVRSFFLHLSGNLDEAQAHAEKAISINPNCSRAYRILGLSLKASGDPNALIIKTREKALHLDPASPTELINLYGELPVRGRYKEAVALLDRIKAIQDPSVFNDWGRHFNAWNRGRLKECLSCYSKGSGLLEDRQWFFSLQRILSIFGYGKMVEHLHPVAAFEIYYHYGMKDDADRLGTALIGNQEAGKGSIPPITLALWHVHKKEYREADIILQSIGKDDPDAWGPHFDLDEACLGARLSWLVRSKLGDTEGATYYENRLRHFYSARQLDFEGVHKATYYLGTCIAAMGGDTEAALDEIRFLIDRFPGSSLNLFCDPLLKNLAENSAFQGMKQETLDHIATEKQASIASGLLPPDADLF